MRRRSLTIFRLGLVAVVAYIAFQALAPSRLGYLVPLVGLLGAGVWLAFEVRRRQRRRAAEREEERWAEALMDPALRAEVRREVAAERARLDRGRHALRRARLAIVEADLLDAAGDAAGARRVLADVELRRLPPHLAAVIGHNRVLAALSEGDVEGADAALRSARRAASMSHRFELLEGLIAVERGRGEDALEIAARVRDLAEDPDVRVEARVLKAVALDALDDRADALRVFGALDRDTREVLAVLGLPRVRTLAEASLDRKVVGTAGETRDSAFERPS